MFHANASTVDHPFLLQVMAIIQTLLKGEKCYACHIIEYIILICTPYIIGCYVKIHDRHSHKEQTIQLINNIIRNPYYKENPTIQ